jgi:hypothetical protein
MWISDDLDELTYDHEDDGVLVRKQLDRVVLARGSWATVMFLFQDLDRATGAYGAPKMAIVRFQKWKGGYRKHSAFNVSNAAQARELTAVFDRWVPRMTDEAPGDASVDVDDELGAEA